MNIDELLLYAFTHKCDILVKLIQADKIRKLKVQQDQILCMMLERDTFKHFDFTDFLSEMHDGPLYYSIKTFGKNITLFVGLPKNIDMYNLYTI